MKARNTKSGTIAELVKEEENWYVVRDSGGRIRRWRNAEMIAGDENQEPEKLLEEEYGIKTPEEPKKAEGDTEFSVEEWFRYVYLPCIIAEMAWDYTETVRETAVVMKMEELKMPCRALRVLHEDYDSIRRKRTLTYVAQCAKDGTPTASATQLMNDERDMMEWVMEHYSDTINYECNRLRNAILRAIPRLDSEDPNLYDYLLSVAMAMAMTESFVRYSKYSLSAHLRIGRVASLPSQIVDLRNVMPVMFGNHRGKGIEEAVYKSAECLTDMFRKMKFTEDKREKLAI